MKHQTLKRNCILTTGLFALFLLFTVLVTCLDVRAVGPGGSSVGLATLNDAVFSALGTNTVWERVTDLLGGITLLTAAAFACLGLYQLVRRRSLWRVDTEILLLGVFYLIVIALYLFFDLVPVNFRPVLIDGALEPSYPSSHTVLSVCVMASAVIALHRLFPHGGRSILAADLAAGLILFFTVLGRLLSGVHWFTDIVGGVLLSAALVMLYAAALSLLDAQEPGRRIAPRR